MAQFLGTHQSKLDSKGRVSVPASFRAALRSLREHDNGGTEVAMVLRPSHQYPCIEAWPENAFQALTAELEQFSEISEEHEDLATTLFGNAYPVESDKEGRVVLSDDLLKFAGITGPIAFVGIGSRFQIWEPAAAEVRQEQARQRVRELQAAMRAKAAA